MVKVKKTPPKKRKKIFRLLFIVITVIGVLSLLFVLSFCYFYEKTYQDKVYKGVRIDGVIFGGKTREDIEKYFQEKSKPFIAFDLILTFEDKISTISGKSLNVTYNGKLSSVQAFSIGRSGYFLSDIYQKWKAATSGINLSSVLEYNSNLIDDTLSVLSENIDLLPQDALFQFENGKVTSFKLSKPGRKLNIEKTKQTISSYIISFAREPLPDSQKIVISLPVETVLPKVTTENSNTFGIKELLGAGYSKFFHSIPGRINNIELASSRINGHLIYPDTVFSFNDTLGDVSSTTGFQPAYIIKDGRTVLGDGGGVCQVSTTLFRAALNAGLPITERHAHAYRVSYYEQDSPPGIDATVYAPGYDLKIKNDSSNYILIQTRFDRNNYALTFELYGTKDGRQAEITKPVILSQTAPPDDLYQDDPTLLKDTLKQVDWKAWGAKVNFDYKVTRNGETLTQQSFFSNFKPWQAIFLRGTRE